MERERKRLRGCRRQKRTAESFDEECLDEDLKEVKVQGKKIPRSGAFQEGDVGGTMFNVFQKNQGAASLARMKLFYTMQLLN